MAWRVHLTNQAIQQLHILPGKSPILAIWTRFDRVHYYELLTGTFLDEKHLPQAPNEGYRSTIWQEFTGSLTGPDTNMYLPMVRTSQGDIYLTDDGKMRLYRSTTSDARVMVETDGVETLLNAGDAQRITSLDLDRALGMIAFLDERNRLHLFQQDISVGVFDIGLADGASEDYPTATVVVARGGSNVFATDGRRLVVTDASGKVLKRLEAHYRLGRIACSPSGNMVVTSDIESGVLRLYEGETLTLTHQRFAIDLIAEAAQIQLMADLPAIDTSISALVAHSRGQLAFAMSGVVCVTDASYMDRLPRPKALF
jgi:hypothetical protein